MNNNRDLSVDSTYTSLLRKKRSHCANLPLGSFLCIRDVLFGVVQIFAVANDDGEIKMFSLVLPMYFKFGLEKKIKKFSSNNSKCLL